MFNEVFFTDVRIPAENLVGEVNGGWSLAKVTLGNERVSLSIGRRAVGHGPDGVRPARHACGQAAGATTRSCASASPPCTRGDAARPDPPADGVGPHQGRAAGAGGVDPQDPRRRARPADDGPGPRPAGARRAHRSTPPTSGATASCSHPPSPSAAAPARCSATSSPSGCSASPTTPTRAELDVGRHVAQAARSHAARRRYVHAEAPQSRWRLWATTAVDERGQPRDGRQRRAARPTTPQRPPMARSAAAMARWPRRRTPPRRRPTTRSRRRRRARGRRRRGRARCHG